MNVRLTLLTTSVAVLAVAALAHAQSPAPIVQVAPAMASTAPVAPQLVSTARPTSSVTPAIASANMVAPVAQVATMMPLPAVAPVPAIAGSSDLDAAEAPQAATAPQPSPKVVRPVVAATPRATVNPVGDDQQAPPPPPVTAQAPRAARAPEAPPPPPAAPKVQATRIVKGQLVNLRLEFTITDQIGSATPVKKTVTMNIADGESGRIRTNAQVWRKMEGNMRSVSIPLSIDAKPEVEGTKIRLAASLDYQLLSDSPSADVPGGQTSISQSVTSILNDGVQVILSQSADPLTDRKVTLEVKATIVK